MYDHYNSANDKAFNGLGVTMARLGLPYLMIIYAGHMKLVVLDMLDGSDLEYVRYLGDINPW